MLLEILVNFLLAFGQIHGSVPPIGINIALTIGERKAKIKQQGSLLTGFIRGGRIVAKKEKM